MTPYTADPRALAAELSPTALDVYLIAKGYEREMEAPNLYRIYRHPRDRASVEVPINPGFIDYGRRMHEALEALDGAFLGLLHAIDPRRFPRERILVLAGGDDVTAPLLTPAEQIRRFIKRHPGEWQAVGSPFVHGGARDFPDGASLSTAAGYVVLMPGVRGVVVNVSKHGYDAARVGQTSGADILTRIAARIADACQIYEVSADTLPPWLSDPVRRELRRRAGELLTLAGSSPADVVSAAETVDEALCKRAPAEPTLSAVLATLMEIGMSCQWIRNPGDTGISPEREALQDARTVLHGDDDAIMTREQLLDLVSNLRRILGVTLTPLEKYIRGPAPRCFNEGRDAMICARDEAQADGDHERVAWLQALLDGGWRDPAPQHRRVLETP